MSIWVKPSTHYCNRHLDWARQSDFKYSAVCVSRIPSLDTGAAVLGVLFYANYSMPHGSLTRHLVYLYFFDVGDPTFARLQRHREAIMSLKSKIILGAFAGAVAFAYQPAVAEMQKQEFKVVGTWELPRPLEGTRRSILERTPSEAVGRQAHGECQIPD